MGAPYQVLLGDCMKAMPTLPDNSVDLILTDPPYFKVKGEAWDRQWDKPEAFLEWIGLLCGEWHRLLKPNGSLYVFASGSMAGRVEAKLSETFNVLNHVVWTKACMATFGLKYGEDRARQFVNKSERILFAEQKPMWPQMLHNARERRGMSRQDVSEYVLGSRSGACWNWEAGIRFPEKQHWEKLMSLFEELPSYETIERPFKVSINVQYTDVWDFPTVSHYLGKHPCEKPNALLRHIVQTSSRPEAVVLDCFMGSGSTGVACAQLGRQFIGIEMDERYFYPAQERVVGEYERVSGKPEGLFG